MNKKIMFIREAFNMQPQEWHICEKEIDYHNLTPDEKHIHSPHCIQMINEFWTDDGNCYYKGFNYNNQLLFDIHAKSVNVFYDV